jgi:hypothetical protein
LAIGIEKACFASPRRLRCRLEGDFETYLRSTLIHLVDILAFEIDQWSASQRWRNFKSDQGQCSTVISSSGEQNMMWTLVKDLLEAEMTVEVRRLFQFGGVQFDVTELHLVGARNEAA